MKRIAILSALMILFFEKRVSTEQLTIINQITTTTYKYSIDIEGEDFFSNLLISWLGKNFIANSKEVLWQDILTLSNAPAVIKELKIQNSKKELFYLLNENGVYSGKISFKETKDLDADLVKNLFSVIDFLNANRVAGDGFTVSIRNTADIYEVGGKVVNIEDCGDNQNFCKNVFIKADVFKKAKTADSFFESRRIEKIISIEVSMNKEKNLAAKIILAKVKTLFWPHINITISLKNA